jgi:hypothetical protein
LWLAEDGPVIAAAPRTWDRPRAAPEAASEGHGDPRLLAFRLVLVLALGMPFLL